MYILDIDITMKTMVVKKLEEFIFENYYQPMQFSFRKKLLFNETLEKRIFKFWDKVNRKISDTCNGKEHYQSFLKNTKSVKRSKMITQKSKPVENPKIIDIKSVTIEHLKNSHKLSQSLGHAKKVGAGF